MGVSATNILDKQPGESYNLSFEFSDRLQSGDSISSIYYVSGVKIGGENATDLHLGTPFVSGTQVVFACASGTAFNRYRVETKILTSLGDVLEGDGFLHITQY